MPNMNYQEKDVCEHDLLKNIQLHEYAIRSLLSRLEGRFAGEDGIYRFYNQSFKAFYLQESTEQIANLLKKLLNIPLNQIYLDIISEGTGKEFTEDTNKSWTKEVQPIVNAFLHSLHILKLIVKYGLDSTDKKRMDGNGWSTILVIYNLD